MHLIQILLPMYDNDGKPFPRAKFSRVKATLARRFGGATIYSRSPAEGLNKQGTDVVRDDIVVFEVMTDTLSAAWWKPYRMRLEKTFRQDEIVVRASTIERL